MTKVINLYGGPGTGKSTTAAALFARLKAENVECELVREYAKDVVWEGRTYLLENQIYIFAKQLKRQMDLRGKVDYIVTDSPILLSAIYGKDELLQQLVRQEHAKFDTVDVMLTRTKPYHQNGRLQTEAEAIVLDEACRDMLGKVGTWYEVAGDGHAADNIYNILFPLPAQAVQDGTNSIIEINPQDTDGGTTDARWRYTVRGLEYTA